MERIANNFRLLWRAERLLAEQEIRLGTRRLAVQALGGLIAAFGLAMMGIAMFFALEPFMGAALAALAVAVVDLIVAAVLFGMASSMSLPPQTEMVREMRDSALEGLRDEAAAAEAEVASLAADVRDFARNPIRSILPAVARPMVAAVTRGLRGAKKSD